jgi:hypothetical protein
VRTTARPSHVEELLYSQRIQYCRRVASGVGDAAAGLRSRAAIARPGVEHRPDPGSTGANSRGKGHEATGCAGVEDQHRSVLGSRHQGLQRSAVTGRDVQALWLLGHGPSSLVRPEPSSRSWAISQI